MNSNSSSTVDSSERESMLVRAYNVMLGHASMALLGQVVAIAHREFGYTGGVSDAIGILESSTTHQSELINHPFAGVVWVMRERKADY